MRELGYSPNSVARALATGRSSSLGVVSFDTTLHGPASTLLGIERAAHEAGYFIVVASLERLDRASIADAVGRLGGHGVDGILVIAPHESAAEALQHADAAVPLVAVEAGPEASVPVIAVDQVAGAAAATRHLLELGHRTVCHVTGPREFLEAQQRARGWRETLAGAGASVPEPLPGDWSASSGYQLGRRLAENEEVSAIFVANDQMALGVLRAMHEAGRRVPEQVSVVGFDDIPEAPYFTPPLTTVRQDFDELGQRSLRALVALIERDAVAGATPPVAPELIVRASTAPVPRDCRCRDRARGRDLPG